MEFEKQLIIGTTIIAILLLEASLAIVISIIRKFKNRKKKSDPIKDQLAPQQAIVTPTQETQVSTYASYEPLAPVIQTNGSQTYNVGIIENPQIGNQQNFQFQTELQNYQSQDNTIINPEITEKKSSIWKKILQTFIWLIIAVFNLGLVSALGYIIYTQFFTVPKVESHYPAWESHWDDYKKPIDIKFNVPISADKLILNRTPEIKGHYEYVKSFEYLPFVREIKFYPEETIYPGQEVIFYYAHVRNVFDNVQNNYNGEEYLKFYSIDPPKIIDSNPKNDSTNIGIDGPIVFTLDNFDGEYVKWEFEISDPEVQFEIERNESKEIKLKILNKLKQGFEYKVDAFQTVLSKNLQTGEVRQSTERKNIYSLKFKTVNAPSIKSFFPQGSSIVPSSNIEIVFTDEMDKQSIEEKFSIIPNVAGKTIWKDEYTLTFDPSANLTPDTKYDVIIAKGYKSKKGGVSNSAISYSFKTLGNAKVISFQPRNQSTGVNDQGDIRITFDQQVDHASAQEHFSINPNIESNISWSGNTMIIKPKGTFTFSQAYTATVSSGVKSISGFDSNQAYTSTFTIEPQQISLSVPLYKQKLSKSCQIVATQMILGYKGISKDVMTIYNELPHDNTPCNPENNTWGNPQVGFVGDINGNYDCASGKRGYGIYWNPISAYLSKNGIRNEVKRNWDTASLAAEVQKGHPVMLWWQNGWIAAEDISWSTPEGQKIYAIKGTHSEIVIGFIGPTENPTHFIVNDPWRGRRTLEVSYFKSLWRIHGNTAIVVY